MGQFLGEDEKLGFGHMHAYMPLWCPHGGIRGEQGMTESTRLRLAKVYSTN